MKTRRHTQRRRCRPTLALAWWQEERKDATEVPQTSHRYNHRGATDRYKFPEKVQIRVQVQVCSYNNTSCFINSLASLIIFSVHSCSTFASIITFFTPSGPTFSCSTNSLDASHGTIGSFPPESTSIFLPRNGLDGSSDA